MNMGCPYLPAVASDWLLRAPRHAPGSECWGRHRSEWRCAGWQQSSSDQLASGEIKITVWQSSTYQLQSWQCVGLWRADYLTISSTSTIATDSTCFFRKSSSKSVHLWFPKTVQWRFSKARACVCTSDRLAVLKCEHDDMSSWHDSKISITEQ